MSTGTFRNRLTTLTLHTTSFVYRKKESLKTAHAFKAIWLILVVLCTELFLNIISIPLYAALRDDGTANDSATKSYRTRRVMTLSVVLFLVILWVIKLAFIIYLSFASTHGRYTVNELPLHTTTISGMTIDLPKTTLDATLTAPTLTEVRGDQGEVMIIGHTVPHGTVIITVEKTGAKDSDHPRLYADTADSAGNFSTIEDPAVFTLPNGRYSAHATLYDHEHGTRSMESNAVPLIVTPDFISTLFAHLDPIINILMIAFVVIGLLATILTV